MTYSSQIIFSLMKGDYTTGLLVCLQIAVKAGLSYYGASTIATLEAVKI